MARKKSIYTHTIKVTLDRGDIQDQGFDPDKVTPEQMQELVTTIAEDCYASDEFETVLYRELERLGIPKERKEDPAGD